MSSPLVSIVIPSYNHALFIKECIQSIIEQDYKNIELIIIDDGSKDNSVEVIQKMIPICKERFKRFEFRHRPNKGLSATLNEALEWCEGEYFSAFASDDIALKHKTSFLVEKLQEENCQVAFGLINEFPKTKSIIKSPTIFHTFEKLIFQFDIPAAPAAMAKTSVIRAVGGYNEGVIIEDWYMWLTLTKNGYTLITYPEVLALYRRHDTNISNNFDILHEGRMQILRLFNDNIFVNNAIKLEYLKKAKRLVYNYPRSAISFLKKAELLKNGSWIALSKIIISQKLIEVKRKLVNPILKTERNLNEKFKWKN